MIQWVVAAGVAAVAYVNRQKIGQWLSNKGLPVPGVQPSYNPAQPISPTNVPSSWAYQGQPAAPAPASGGQTSIVIAPGSQSASPKTGDQFTATLPSGAKWAAQDADMIPTELGGNVISDFTVGLTAPLVITGIAGSAVVELNWEDASGNPQQTLLSVVTS